MEHGRLDIAAALLRREAGAAELDAQSAAAQREVFAGEFVVVGQRELLHELPGEEIRLRRRAGGFKGFKGTGEH